MLGALMLRPDHRAGPCAVAGGVAMLAEIPEASGLAVSRRHPGVIWTHNDSGHAATLFALDLGGAVRGRVAVPLRTRDWEDVSAGRCASHDCLYIADIGDNSLARRTIQIARVPEPALGDARTATPEIFTAEYEDGPHNAEALFIIGADLFIVTRERRGAVYRATTVSSPGRTLTFRRVGELGLAAVTDAEASRDEQSFVVRTSHEAVLYRTADSDGGPFRALPANSNRWIARAPGRRRRARRNAVVSRQRRPALEPRRPTPDPQVQHARMRSRGRGPSGQACRRRVRSARPRDAGAIPVH